jgi:hypothetical protein
VQRSVIRRQCRPGPCLKCVCFVLSHTFVCGRSPVADCPGTPFGKSKILSAFKKYKSVDVELLTQLCKELRNRYGDTVSYDGASATDRQVHHTRTGMAPRSLAAAAWPSAARERGLWRPAVGCIAETSICAPAGTVYGERLADRNTKKALAAFDEAVAASAFG